MKPLSVFWVLMLGRALTPGAPSPMGILATNEIAPAQSHASSNLTVLQASITQANYALLGFHATNELSQMALSEPVVVHSLSLARLRNYHLGDDFSTLLEAASRVIFPIVVGTNVRSSIAFRLDSARNSVSGVEIGQRKLIRELMATYRSIPLAWVKPGDAPFAVEIPVFDIWLIGYVNARDQVVLLATVDLPLGPVTINRGQAITDAAMLRLATVSQRYNGQPN